LKSEVNDKHLSPCKWISCFWILLPRVQLGTLLPDDDLWLPVEFSAPWDRGIHDQRPILSLQFVGVTVEIHHYLWNARYDYDMTDRQLLSVSGGSGKLTSQSHGIQTPNHDYDHWDWDRFGFFQAHRDDSASESVLDLLYSLIFMRLYCTNSHTPCFCIVKMKWSFELPNFSWTSIHFVMDRKSDYLLINDVMNMEMIISILFI
jgi:hypothetical protein